MTYWKDNADSWVCSTCGYESGSNCPICPNCGAPMENVVVPHKKAYTMDTDRARDHLETLSHAKSLTAEQRAIVEEGQRAIEYLQKVVKENVSYERV